jgi:SAM-dependent methyltransferase
MLGDGRTVLEIGCGLGFMLHELRNRGFQVQGADVAKIAVDLNRQEGFTVWHGNVDSIPEDVGDFDAVVSMFMLHHLPDPLGFVQRLRQRWPDAFLSITQYGPTNYDPVRTRPPRTLTRWNKQSLSKLLEIAGYETQVLELPSTGAEKKAFNTIQGSKVVHRILGKVQAPPALFQANMYFMNHLLPKIAGSLRMEAFVLQAFGRPQRG